MERIKQALARAREERLQNAGTEPAAAAPARAPSAREILYTQTRQERPPQNLLREQRVISAFDTGAFTDGGTGGPEGMVQPGVDEMTNQGPGQVNDESLPGAKGMMG